MDKKSMKAQSLLAQKEMKDNAPRGRGRPSKVKTEDKKKPVVDDKDVKDKMPKKEDRSKSPPSDKSAVMKDLKMKLKEVERKQRETDKSLKKIESEMRKM
tara:strand:- start:33 stop:332 length:300 start_codon:yes stop_codon:yes gene_type:complete